MGATGAGGIGVVHRNLDGERQAEEGRRVKNFLHGLIEDPVVFRHDILVADVVREKEERNYTFTGFPIVNDDGRLCGILTARDVKFLSEHDVPVSEVMSSQPITAPQGTSLTEAYEIMTREKVGKLPIVDVEGNEAADTLFFNANDPSERYSAVDTVREQGKVYLTTGTELRSNLNNVMLTINADTCGRHDTLGGACASESTARTIAILSRSASIPATKLRSIFSTSIGRRCR